MINLPYEKEAHTHVYELRAKNYAVVQWDDKKSKSIKVNAKKNTIALHPVIGDRNGAFMITPGVVNYFNINANASKSIDEVFISPTYDNIEKLLSLVGKEKVYFCPTFLERAKTIINNRLSFLSNRDFIDSLTLESVEKEYNHTSLVPMFAHQKIGILQLVLMPTWGLLWQPGTGKTGTVSVAVKTLLEQKKITKAVIVVRAVLRQQWADEFETFTGIKPTILMSNNFSDIADNGVFIVSYAGLVINNDKAKKEINRDTFLCLDESTEIKNNSDRTKAILRLGNRAGRKCILTGTIVSENVSNAFYQIKFLDLGERLGTSRQEFQDEYSSSDAFERMSDKIFDISSRFRLDDIAELPPITTRFISLDMDKEQSIIYKNAISKELVNLSSHNIRGSIVSSIPLVNLIKARQVTSGFVSVKDLDSNGMTDEDSDSKCVRIGDTSPKERMLETLVVDYFNSNMKAIIWTNFKEEARIVVGVMRKLGIDSFRLLDGGTSPGNRDKYCKEYQDGDVNFLVAATKTLQFGKNLQSTNKLVYYSLSYSYMDFTQSLARARRIGLKHKVEAIILTCKYTIDEAIMKAIESKQELSSLINGDNIEKVFRGEF